MDPKVLVEPDGRLVPFDDSGNPIEGDDVNRGPKHIFVQPGDVLWVSRKRVKLERDPSSDEGFEVIRARGT